MTSVNGPLAIGENVKRCVYYGEGGMWYQCFLLMQSEDRFLLTLPCGVVPPEHLEEGNASLEDSAIASTVDVQCALEGLQANTVITRTVATTVVDMPSEMRDNVADLDFVDSPIVFDAAQQRWSHPATLTFAVRTWISEGLPDTSLPHHVG